MRIIYIILLLSLVSCKNKLDIESRINNKEFQEKGAIIYFVNKEDTTVHVDIKNWQDSLPDSIYNIKVISIAVLDSSNIKLRKGFLQKMSSVGIYDSRLGEDTLYLDSSFKNLDYLSIIDPRCTIINLDTIRIRKLDYFSSDSDYKFNINLNKVNGLDSIIIKAPTEYIDIPINKSYKYIAPCTKNNQLEKLKKHYNNVSPWFKCN